MLIEQLLSKNNDRNGRINLYQHSINVANTAMKIAIDLIPKDEYNEYSQFIEEVYFSALFHDIGKCSTQFQEYLENGNKDYIYHNILGASLIDNYLLFSNDRTKKKILKTVLFHHPISNNNIKMGIGDEFDRYKTVISELLTIFSNKFKDSIINPRLDYNIKEDDIEENDAPYYFGENKCKLREIVTDDSQFFSISLLVKLADIIESTNFDYEKSINRNNTIDYFSIKKPNNYDERFYVQQKYVEELIKNKSNVFNCQTGFGKTLLAALTMLRVNNKKVFWVCPRNSIAKSVYITLKNEIKALGLDDKLSVGLLLTNEWKEGNSESDIVVTNIDNFSRPIFNNDSKERLTTLLHSNCVFDEFHEYITDAPLMAVFHIINRARIMFNSYTLYLSATPIYNFIKQANIIEHKDDSIINKKYKISFVNNVDNIDFNNENFFISVNSVGKSQEFMLNEKVNNLIHTRFVDSDLNAKLNELMSEHSNKKNIINTSWSATNIISTGIDISFDNICVYLSSPEKLIQSIGRCNRWNDGKDNHKIIIVKPFNKDEKSENAIIKEIYDKDLCILFYNLLYERLSDKKEITFGEIYNIRTEFLSKYKKEFDAYFKEKLSESYENIKEMNYNFSQINDNNDEKEERLGKNILRGKTEQFYCTFENSKELFIGNKMIFSNIFKDNIDYDSSKIILNYIFDKIKNNKNYFKHKKHFENIKNKNYNFIINKLIEKAVYKNSPFPIPHSFYYYDNNVGIIKTN